MSKYFFVCCGTNLLRSKFKSTFQNLWLAILRVAITSKKWNTHTYTQRNCEWRIYFVCLYKVTQVESWTICIWVGYGVQHWWIFPSWTKKNFCFLRLKIHIFQFFWPKACVIIRRQTEQKRTREKKRRGKTTSQLTN